MKKYILFISIILSIALLNAFDNFVPAEEMSGKYLKFRTCYQKIFGDFDGGFNRFGFSLTKPLLYKKMSLGTDFQMDGDGVFKKLSFNLSSGISINKNYIFALSTGFVQRSLNTGDLIFNEAETIDNDSITKAIIGASFYGKFYHNKLSFSLGTYHLNTPDISFNKNDDKLPLKIKTDLTWKINSIYQIGAFYMREDKQDYLGVKFDIKFPAPYLNHELRINKESISYRPSLHTFNYWNFTLGYDYYFDSENLGYENFGICCSYEYPGSNEPIVKWIDLSDETDKQDYVLKFRVDEPERLKFVNVYQNEECVFSQETIWEFEDKEFTVPMQLKEGENILQVKIKGVTGPVYTYDLQAYYFEEEELIEEPTIEDDLEEEVIVEEIQPDTTEVEEVDAIIIAVEKDITGISDSTFFYPVEKGDCLWNIAKKEEVYNDPWKWKVIYENNGDIIKNPDLIYPGQKFLIIKEKIDDNVIYYRVKKGDCLWNIAKKEEIFNNPRKWNIIYLINKDTIKDPNLIHPGQNLKIIIRENK